MSFQGGDEARAGTTAPGDDVVLTSGSDTSGHGAVPYSDVVRTTALCARSESLPPGRWTLTPSAPKPPRPRGRGGSATIREDSEHRMPSSGFMVAPPFLSYPRLTARPRGGRRSRDVRARLRAHVVLRHPLPRCGEQYRAPPVGVKGPRPVSRRRPCSHVYLHSAATRGIGGPHSATGTRPCRPRGTTSVGHHILHGQEGRGTRPRKDIARGRNCRSACRPARSPGRPPTAPPASRGLTVTQVSVGFDIRPGQGIGSQEADIPGPARRDRDAG